MIGTDYTGSCKSNYHTTTTAPCLLFSNVIDLCIDIYEYGMLVFDCCREEVELTCIVYYTYDCQEKYCEICCFFLWKERGVNDDSEDESQHIQDTVGAIAMDTSGNLAAAVSSGGISLKQSGRLGPVGIFIFFMYNSNTCTFFFLYFVYMNGRKVYCEFKIESNNSRWINN